MSKVNNFKNRVESYALVSVQDHFIECQKSFYKVGIDAGMRLKQNHLLYFEPSRLGQNDSSQCRLELN